MRWRIYKDQRGVALMTALLLAVVVSGMVVGAALIGSNALIINRYEDRQGWMEAAALAGVEEARARVNGDTLGVLYPDSGYATLEDGAAVTDASGQPIAGLHRWTYAGPIGMSSGQYGVFGSVVTLVEDAEGNRLVRRGEIFQESFAKFAYFTDIEGSIVFANGDQIFGPLHSNDRIRIHSSGATFHGPVTTARTISGKNYATFKQGYTEDGPHIPLPQTAELDKLRTQAQAGSVAFVGNTNGSSDQATLRIEFMAIDLNDNGQVNDPDEGFIRVYQSANAAWVSGDVPNDYNSNGLRNSENCGHYHADGTFVSAVDHGTSGSDTWIDAVTDSNRKRCHLGGADSLFNGFQPMDGIGPGEWLQWTGPIDPRLSGRPDSAYLFPISRALNSNFKGVIFVDGKVVISGTLNGRVTLAATNNIIIGDDVKYVTDPGSGNCNDILGIFSGTNVVVAHNTLNTPTRYQPSGGIPYRTYDDTKDEFIHGFVLALDVFTVDSWDVQPSSAEACEATPIGRGCLYLTGGIIQRQRGAVGTTGGTGYLKRYSYDACGLLEPPPYFPTTGHFARGRYFEVDPISFDVDAYFAALTGS